MYTYKYVLKMTFPCRLKEDFTESEKCSIENTRLNYNDKMIKAPRKNVKNKKYLSSIKTDGPNLIFEIESEFPIEDLNQLGKHLRMFSMLALDTGLDLYVDNNKLMRRVSDRLIFS